MSKLEAVLDGLCGTGVVLAPLYLVYKFVIFAVS